MSAYGPSKFKPGVFLPHFDKGATSTTPAVKTEAMKCYTALYRWMGEATDGFLGSLKDI
jgi:hypothetical protein